MTDWNVWFHSRFALHLTHFDRKLSTLSASSWRSRFHEYWKQQLFEDRKMRTEQRNNVATSHLNMSDSTGTSMLAKHWYPIHNRSFVAHGTRRLWMPCAPACRSFTSFQTGHTHTHTHPAEAGSDERQASYTRLCPGTAASGLIAIQLHCPVSRNSHEWVGSCPQRWCLPDHRNGSSAFTWQASYTHRCPSAVTPASQLCNPASRHCGTTKTHNGTSLSWCNASRPVNIRFRLSDGCQWQMN